MTTTFIIPLLVMAFSLLPMIPSVDAQNVPPLFNHSIDVGAPELSGSTKYDSAQQVYSLIGSGYNIWFERDEFHFAYLPLAGDFLLTGQFAFTGNEGDPHRKTGWMVRASLEDNAAHMSAVIHGDGLTVLQWRALKGAFMRDPEDEIFAPKSGYEILQIERQGDRFIMRAAHPGEPLQDIGAHLMPDMPDTVFVGAFICAHQAEMLQKVQVWNVRLTRPVPEAYDAYRDGRLGSRLEIMEVATGKRKTIHTSEEGFEAPNWMPDGKHLLYNQNGSLYTIPIDGGKPSKLSSGFANRNNNDHVISPDGTMLGISHHRDGMPGGGSTIYVLPLSGGDPQMVTRETPSYLHGWSPDGRSIIYTAQRGDDPNYHLYTAEVATGLEKQLTQFDHAHVDGPEYAPDGSFIYFNGSQTGTMQIWRMRPDGNDVQQMTFDQYNDWFPHISPDGTQCVFLSYPESVPASDHPWYRRVMLRLIRLDQPGSPRVLAHLYGGQGSINVPSWSPDGKYIAFVSNPGNVH